MGPGSSRKNDIKKTNLFFINLLAWLIIQLYTAWRWMYLPSRHRNYPLWLWRHRKMVSRQIRALMEKRYGWNSSNGYGMTDDSGSWEADERVDAGDSWGDVEISSNISTQPLIRKTVIKGD